MHKERPYLEHLDPNGLPTPCFVIDRTALVRNGEMLRDISRRSKCKVLLALKAFSCTKTFDLLQPYLDGVCASSPHEARLGRDYFKKDVHTYSPAFSESSLRECLEYSDHIVFNHPNQLNRYSDLARNSGVSVGLRVNPSYSEQEVELYDPCAKGSRLGTPIEDLTDLNSGEVDGLHLHTLCEQGFGPLERTVEVLESKLGALMKGLSWLNLGGGHHITQPDYDIEGLVKLLVRLRETYELQVILEPGEAVAINTGALICRVLDVMSNGMAIAIVDASVTCHMPDVLEMPYRPDVRGAGHPSEFAHTYRIGGQSCLAGDIAGDYSFPEPLEVGQELIFEDMSHYTMVKTTTFNGVGLPAIGLYDSQSREVEVIAEFGYDDFLSRLG